MPNDFSHRGIRYQRFGVPERSIHAHIRLYASSRPEFHAEVPTRPDSVGIKECRSQWSVG